MRVTARFSNGGGDPGIPDYAKEGRGLAVSSICPTARARTSSGSACPASSRARRRTSSSSRALASPIRRPASPTSARSAPGSRRIPRPGRRSRPRCHDQSAGELRHGHVQLDPLLPLDRAGRHRALRALPVRAGGRRERALEEDAKARGRDYLQEEIAARDSAAFRMIAVIAEDGDAVDDPTVPFPGRTRAGRARPPGADRPGHGTRARRRHPRLRPHPRHRRHRSVRRRDPPLPPARLLGIGNAPQRRPRPGVRGQTP